MCRPHRRFQTGLCQTSNGYKPQLSELLRKLTRQFPSHFVSSKRLFRAFHRESHLVTESRPLNRAFAERHPAQQQGLSRVERKHPVGVRCEGHWGGNGESQYLDNRACAARQKAAKA